MKFDKRRMDRLKKIWDNQSKLQAQLLSNLKTNLPELKDALKAANSHWGYEDPVYRFYHRSFKVYDLQGETLKIVDLLNDLTPEYCWLNEGFMRIIDGGTGKAFELSHNNNWDENTRPIVEAFFHAKFFLEMAVKYGEELEEAPQFLPSGWAAFLYLFNLR